MWRCDDAMMWGLVIGWVEWMLVIFGWLQMMLMLVVWVIGEWMVVCKRWLVISNQ